MRVFERRALNQFGWKSVRSAMYHHEAQLEISRCDTAAAKRSVWVIIQSGGEGLRWRWYEWTHFA